MCSTCPLVFGCCELSHVILSLRKITWLNSQQPKTRARGHVEHLDQLMKIINFLIIFRCCCGLSVANHTFPLFAPVPPLSESSPAESMSHSASGPQHQSSGGAGASTQGNNTIIKFDIKIDYSRSRPRDSVIFLVFRWPKSRLWKQV